MRHAKRGDRDDTDTESASRTGAAPGKRARSEKTGPAGIESRLDDELAGGSGAALPASAASRAQRTFGASFDDVRVHTSGAAAQMNAELGYKAFAYGSDLFFGAGAYQPDTPNGEHVLMHELAHVAQTGGRRAGGVQGRLAIGTSSDAAEVDADRGAAAAMEGRTYAVASSPLVLRGFGATGDGVTHEAQTTKGAKEAGFDDRDAEMIYSGNWQRDMNQVMVTFVENGTQPLFEVVNILHTAHFGFPIGGSKEGVKAGTFEGKSKGAHAREFGTYDPVEHIDNTGGLLTEDVFTQAGDVDSAGHHPRAKGNKRPLADTDPRYIAELAKAKSIENPQDNVAHRVDESGIPIYISASRTQLERHLANGVVLAQQPGKNEESERRQRDRALRYAGEALHIMQDYYAHSNFCEIAVNLLLKEGSRTLGDEANITAAQLDARLDQYVDHDGPRTLDTYVHRRDAETPDSGERDKNAVTRGGREIMATGTFTLEDTVQSVKEKALAAINGMHPFKDEKSAGPNKHVVALLTWFESNPEYVQMNVTAELRNLGQHMKAHMGTIEKVLNGAGKGAAGIGRMNARIERGVGGAARRAWHTVAGGVVHLFGDDASKAEHATGAKLADQRAEAGAKVAERDGHETQKQVAALTAQLAKTAGELSTQGRGLPALYEVARGGMGLLSLSALAKRIPLIGTVIAPYVEEMVESLKKKARKRLRQMWHAAKPQIIAELNAAVSLAIGDTEVQRSNAKTGTSTSSAFTQPTHTDIAKDFHSHQHGTEDRFSVVEKAGEIHHRMGPKGWDALGKRVDNSIRTAPRKSAVITAETLSNASHDGEHPHEHQQRHGGAWLAGVANVMATKATRALMIAYRKSITDGPENMKANIAAQNAVVRSWYSHPADCRATWEGPMTEALNGETASSRELLAELARRTSLPPSQQAPNDQQYADDPDHEADHTHHHHHRDADHAHHNHEHPANHANQANHHHDH